jgi:low affinity Fe/Cu permease
MHVFFENLAKWITLWAGSTNATLLAFAVVILWTIGGFFVGFDTDYQMYINTGTTIVTYLVVFLIQRTQNKESTAIPLQLNELLASHTGCSNRLLNIEDLSEKDIEALRKRYKSLAIKMYGEEDRTIHHTIEEIDD